MPTSVETLAAGFQHHQAGRFEQAEHIYRQVLADEPDHADALHLLGLIALQRGHCDAAVQYIRRAIESNGTEAGYYCNLGSAYQAQGKLEEAVASFRRSLELRADYVVAHGNLGNALVELGELDQAIACFRRVVELKPDSAEAHANLANPLHNQGRLDEAVASYGRALALKPDFFVAHYNLANALQTQGNLDEAVASYRRALALAPNHADAHSNLAAALKGQRKLDEAIACYRRAVELEPDCATAHYNLGAALRKHKMPDEAIACHRRAIELNPDYAEAHNELGNALAELGKLDEALECFCRALELKPDLAEAHNNQAAILHEQGQLQEAARCYQRALELNPDYAEAHTNHSMLLLLQGELERAWPEYEWRQKTEPMAMSEARQPQWNGQSLLGKNILIRAEQGLGDTMQFIRYAALVKELAAAVFVECQRPLANILSSCRSIDRLFARGDELPAFDFHAPLLSLPGIFKSSLGTIPATSPYLFADEALVSHWRDKLANVNGFRIGINWRGEQGKRQTRQRDIPLTCFESLAEMPGVRLVSLQKGVGRQDLASSQLQIVDLGDSVDEMHGAFMDTAAIMKSLDLVISSDTSVAHLAGALGAPVWVALSFTPEWRWLLDRSDSPWYPTMRLFRQMSPGDWPSVFEQMKAALSDRLSKPLATD